MARRLTINHSISRSETIRTRLDLFLDDPPFGNITRPPAQPTSGVATRVPPPDVSTTLSKTENDR